jgi:hypothetical protein
MSIADSSLLGWSASIEVIDDYGRKPLAQYYITVAPLTEVMMAAMLLVVTFACERGPLLYISITAFPPIPYTTNLII